ncbi:hypothetical protein FACS1894164_10120 [Spirochaetia bacterium]|nr:hypothetical protein FACS1894164_10120 [Spirochaetia bacterium]
MKKIISMLMLLVTAGMLINCTKKEPVAEVGGSSLVRIKVEIFDRGTDGGKTDAANNQWTRWIQEKIRRDENIIVEFVKVNRWTETEALVNLFAAGDQPDVCYTYSGDNIQNWADQGGIFDLAPYVDTTLKDLKAFLGPDKALAGKDFIRRNIETNTGRIFSIPARRMSVAQRNIWIRKDWLDILGLPLPTTTEEFENALIAFKTQDPGGVTSARVIPFTLNGDRPDWEAGNIMEAFIDPALSDRERWINTVAERSFAVAGYKDGLRFMNKLYNENLVDRDFPIHSSSTTDVANLIKSGVVGSFCGEWDVIYREPDGLLTDLRKNVPTADIVPIDPIQSPDGLTHKSMYDAAGINFFIPASAAKDPSVADAAMRYLNWMAKYENYHFIQTGHEGISHSVIEGVIKLDPSAAADPTWIMNSSQNIDYTMMMNGLFLESEEASIRALAAGYSWSADLITQAYNTALTNAKPGLVVKTSSPLIVAGPLVQTLSDMGRSIYASSITCPVAAFDSTYDTAVRNWLASGAQAIIDERREKFVQP